MNEKLYNLVDIKGNQYLSTEKGTFGGHKKLKIYGRLDCPSAQMWIKKGQYIRYRVFFIDEATAINAGYRPCALCMKEEYKKWKEQQNAGYCKTKKR
ncbi:MAG TPA: metal-binding protein [Gallicola sp.]|nr:metal-binding protein [Gallicola sp.]